MALEIERALFDRVIVEPLEEVKTKGGIHLPQSERKNIGKVTHVGPGINGEKMQIKEGDVVLISPQAGKNLSLGEKEYRFLSQKECYATVKVTGDGEFE